MADKDMPDPLKMNMHPPERNLRAFAAIDQEELFAMA